MTQDKETINRVQLTVDFEIRLLQLTETSSETNITWHKTFEKHNSLDYH